MADDDTRLHRRGLAARSSTSAGRACSCPRRTAASASASSTRSWCRRRWAACRSRARTSRPRSFATLAARGSASTTCSPRSRRANARAPSRSTSRPRRPRRPGPHARRGARARDWCSTGVKPHRARRPHRRLGARRGRAPSDGLGTFLVEAPAPSSLAGARRHPQVRAGSSSTDRGRAASAADGDHAAIWRRIVDDTAVLLAAELVGVRARPHATRGRVRQGARAVRPAARARSRRSGTRPSTCCTQIELARVGAHYAAWASDVDDPSASAAAAMAKGYVARGRELRHRRVHPDPRRRRLHLGLRRAPPLQPGQGQRPAARRQLAPPTARRPRPRLISAQPRRTGNVSEASGEGRRHVARLAGDLVGRDSGAAAPRTRPCASSRARLAPRQRCSPKPNARWAGVDGRGGCRSGRPSARTPPRRGCPRRRASRGSRRRRPPAAELDVGGGGAAERLDRRHPAQALLDRAPGCSDGSAAQRGALVGVLGQGLRRRPRAGSGSSRCRRRAA